MTNDHPLPLTPEEEAGLRAEFSEAYDGGGRFPITNKEVARLLATLDAVRSDRDELDEAWREAEAALPAREWSLSLSRSTGPEQDLLFYAASATCLTDQAGYPVSPFDTRAGVRTFATTPHATPAAALRALAARLSSQGTT